MKFEEVMKNIEKMDADYLKGKAFTLDAIDYGFDDFLEEIKPSADDVLKVLEEIFELPELTNSNQRG